MARTLLTSLLSPQTPLIGHSIDNDLNVVRLVHPTVVDTIFLFPHPRGLPFRLALRNLSSQYLDHTIQTGGAAGHDSLEDARATGDLVRFKIKKEWEKMKLKGWRLKDGEFFTPDGKSVSAVSLDKVEETDQEALEQNGSKGKESEKTKRSIAQVDGSADIKENDTASENEETLTASTRVTDEG
jgi:hypothetical protein